MDIEAISFKSSRLQVPDNGTAVQLSEENGIICSWNATKRGDNTDFQWTFDWSSLKAEGAELVEGTINVQLMDTFISHGSYEFNVSMTDEDSTIDITYPFDTDHRRYATFEYEFDVTYGPMPDTTIEEMFPPSDQNDVALIVEGKRLHMNKAFLSFHSEYFRKLFSTNFREGEMDAIPINDVSAEDFANLFGPILPKPLFATDRTAETILHLAHRFLMPSVTAQVEHHLIYNSKIENATLIWMSDYFGMPRLMEKCIRNTNSVDKARKVRRSPKYEELSAELKGRLFERLLQFIKD